MTPDTPLADDELPDLFAPLCACASVVLAVSGGADSLALLHLYARWRAIASLPAQTALVVTVDHQLRQASAAEAGGVAAQAQALGLPHETLRWEGDKPVTGLPAAARTARYRLMGLRAASLPAPCAIVTAHTLDDQAETLLMRLARGSGIDGLAGMSQVRPLPGYPLVALIRPLLAVPKSRLEATLRAAGISWVDDPTNIDLAFERPRLRAMAKLRATAGLSDTALARSAERLARAQQALDIATRNLEASITTIHPGIETLIDRHLFDDAPAELRIRVVTRALIRQGGGHPQARLSEIEDLIAWLADRPQKVTLGGCIVSADATSISVTREPGRDGLAVLDLTPGASTTWDKRFIVSLDQSAAAACNVRALDPHEWAALRKIMKSTVRAPLTHPSFWTDGLLIAAPTVFDGRDSDQRHALCKALQRRGGHPTFVAPTQTLVAYASMCRSEPVGCLTKST